MLRLPCTTLTRLSLCVNASIALSIKPINNTNRTYCNYSGQPQQGGYQQQGFPQQEQQGGYQQQGNQQGQEGEQGQQAKTFEEFTFELGEDYVCNVSEFKGHAITHVRKYFYNKQQERRPTKEGVTLLPRHLDKLYQTLDDIDAEISRMTQDPGSTCDSQYTFPMDVQGTRTFYVSKREGQPIVTIVQVQAETGNTKQIQLNTDQFNLLKQALPRLQSVSSSISSDAMNIATIFQCNLSDYTVARITSLNEKHFVDIRKIQNNPSATNVAESKVMFTKNGIFLNASEWRRLMEKLDELNEAIKAGNTEYYVDLGRERRVQLTYYNNLWYLSVREFFKNKESGQMFPSKKGINLRMEEWTSLLQQVPLLSARMDSLETVKQ